jgi:ABC-type transporter Mla subunit MlaD
MSAQAHYFKIGVFMFSGITLAVLAVIILGAGALLEKKIMMETYFDESVQGLSVGAPLKYRGVTIGSVEHIGFVRNDYKTELSDDDRYRFGQYIVVRVSVNEVFPGQSDEEREMEVKRRIEEGLRVRLTSQGVTGVVYLEADNFDPHEYPPVTIAWAPKTLYIPSGRSTVTVLGSALTKIAKDLEQAEVHKVAAHLDALLLSLTKLTSETDMSQLSLQAGQALSELRGTLQQARSILANPAIQSFMSDAAATAGEARHLVADLSYASTQIRRMSEELPGTLTRLDTTVRRVDHLVVSKSQDIDQILANLRVVSADLRELMTNAKRYPSQIFLGEPPPHANSARR